MSDGLNLNLVGELSQLVENLNGDIALCKTREEHVRVTARANQASAILTELQKFFSDGTASDGNI